MLFTSMTFLWIFLPAVFIIYLLFKGTTARNTVLLIAGMVFYAWGSCLSDIIVLTLAIFINYGAALFMDGEGRNERVRKTVFIITVVLNAGTLCFFKYPGLSARLPFSGGAEISVPLGISFFTFQSIAYIADVYKRELPAERSLFYYALNISFFAKIISGPIVDNGGFLAQLHGRETDVRKTAYGVKRFIYGFGKKAIIANQLAAAADGLFDIDPAVIPAGHAWLAALLYTFQLYYDSSGYVDMAIGIGAMFGFELPENFNYPYLASSVTDFWRRWHISLTSWFRKYVYFPLGGSRKGNIRTLVNIGIIFALTGIWHGSGLCFLAWGLWHGFFMILERALKPKFENVRIPAAVKYAYTFLEVLTGWVFFRAGSLTRALGMLRAMFLFQTGDALPARMFAGPGVIAVLAAAVVLAGPAQSLCPRLRKALYDREYTGPLQICALAVIFMMSIVFTVSGTYNAFIYFKF